MSKSIFSKLVSRPDEEAQDEVDTSITIENEVELNEEEADQEWLPEGNEGELSVDVFQTDEAVVVKSTIAGVRPEDIDISINNDMLTIRGERKQEEQVSGEDYFYQECYWGAFSRSIILPVEVKAEEVDASLKNGVLTVKLPKAKKSKSVSIKVSTD